VQVTANAVWNLHRETPVQVTLTQRCRAIRQVALALDLPRAFAMPSHHRKCWMSCVRSPTHLISMT
jgi:hypothetical protein